MDIINKFTGGTRLYADDFLVMPNSHRGAIVGIGDALGNGADYIINGVNAVITPGVEAFVQEGHVFLNGEVLKVDSQTVPRTAGTDLYEFQKQTTYPAEFSAQYLDGSTHNIKQSDRAIVVNVASISTLSITGDTSLASSTKSGIITASQFDDIETIGDRLEVLQEGSIYNIEVGVTPTGTTYSVSGDFISAVKTTSLSNETYLEININPINVPYYPIITNRGIILASMFADTVSTSSPLSTTKFGVFLAKINPPTCIVDIYVKLVKLV